MTEHGLDGAKIGSALQQIRCEGVAKHVGGDAVTGYSRDPGQLSQPREEILPGHGAAATREEHRIGTRMTGAQQRGTSSFEVGVDSGQGGLAEGYQSLSSALGEYPEDSRAGVERTQRKRDELRHP